MSGMDAGEAEGSNLAGCPASTIICRAWSARSPLSPLTRPCGAVQAAAPPGKSAKLSSSLGIQLIFCFSLKNIGLDRFTIGSWEAL